MTINDDSSLIVERSFKDTTTTEPNLDLSCATSSPSDTPSIDDKASPVVFEPCPPSYPPIERGNDDNEKCCRICLENDHPQDMIAPCKCKGSSKWVHRQCLDQWRIIETDRAFSKCTECLFVYHLQPTPTSGITVLPSIRRRVKYTLLVTRDVCLATLYLQLAIVFFGWIVSLIDSDRQLPTLMNSNMPVAVYYLFGFLTVLILLGFGGMMLCCCNNCSIQETLAQFPSSTLESDSYQPSYRERSAHYQQSRQNYQQNRDDCCVNCYLCGNCYGSSPSPNYYYYSSGDDCCNLCLCCCHCPEGTSPSAAAASSSSSGGGEDCGNCDGDGAEIVLFILLVLAIFLAIVGFLIGVVLCVIIFQRALQRHIYLLHKRQLAVEFQVMDLAGYDLNNNYGSTTDMEQPQGSSKSPLSTAPTLPERDVTYLRDIGLME